jgi:hypothetical protein
MSAKRLPELRFIPDPRICGTIYLPQDRSITGNQGPSITFWNGKRVVLIGPADTSTGRIDHGK